MVGNFFPGNIGVWAPSELATERPAPVHSLRLSHQLSEFLTPVNSVLNSLKLPGLLCPLSTAATWHCTVFSFDTLNFHDCNFFTRSFLFLLPSFLPSSFFCLWIGREPGWEAPVFWHLLGTWFMPCYEISFRNVPWAAERNFVLFPGYSTQHTHQLEPG